MPVGTEQAFPVNPAGNRERLNDAATAFSACIEQLVFTLDGKHDIREIANRWRRLPSRFDVLRLGHRESDAGETEHFLVDNAELAVVLHDWRNEPGDSARERKLEQFLLSERLAGLNPEQPPLMKVAMLQWQDDRWRVVVTTGHNLLDWRSMSLLLRAVFNDDATLPPGSAEHSFLVHATDAKFWRTYLDGVTEPTRIDLVPPGDGDDVDNEEVLHEVTTEIDVTGSDRIRQLAKAAGATLNNVSEAAWALLLSRYSGRSDVLFGVVRSCRRSASPGIESSIGNFTNVLPLRIRLDAESRVLDLLQQARDQHRRMREHECANLDLVHERAAPASDAPLFDTIIEFDQRDPVRVMDELFEAKGLHGFVHCSRPRNALHLQVYDEEQITLRLKYRRDVMSHDTARRLLSHYEHILMEMAAEPGRTLEKTGFTGAGHCEPVCWPGAQRLVVSGKAASIPAAFEDRVRANPGAAAVACADRVLTYAELDRAANRLAHRLKRNGARAGVLVGLCVDRSVEQMIGILGILKSGAGYVPLDPAYPQERLAFLVDDTAIELAVVSHDTAGQLQKEGKPLRLIDVAIDEGEEPDDSPGTNVDPHDTAYVIHTSGSTGQPKGVIVSHHNVMRLFHACDAWLHAGIGDVWTMFHSFAFDFSVWEMWGALLHGGRLEIVPRDIARSPEAFHQLLQERGVTVLNQTPSAFRQLIRVDGERDQALPALRLVVFGGEKLDFAMLEDWVKRHGDDSPKLVNMYGITETTVHVTYRPVTRRDIERADASLIGWPLPDLYVRLLDREGRPVPRGVRGEICIGGAGVSKGYLNRPELDAQRFVRDPFSSDPDARLYRSGDIGRQMPDGELCYLGRNDDQLKIRGFRIDPGEIANTARKLSGVEDAVVVPRRSAEGNVRLAIYYVANGELAPDVLRDELRELLPEHMVPAIAMRLDGIPLNNNNKVDFKALPEPGEIPADTNAVTHPPQGDVEQTLADIWSRVLERSSIGRTDDFFGLGGDSVLALQLVSRARAEGLEITPRDVFTHSGLAELAAVAQAASTNNPDEETTLNMDGPLELAPIQHWFLDQHFEEPHHCNHAWLFKVPPGTDVELLEKACLEVVRHHDALHMRFERNAQDRWQARTVEPHEALEFSRIELDHLGEDELKEAIALITDDIQRSLSISSGLMMRVAHFTGGLETGDRLMIAVHRLAADHASWGIILQDIDAAYRALAAGRTPTLPAHTTSYAQWAAQLARCAQSQSVAGERAYWEQMLQAGNDVGLYDKDGPRGREDDVRVHAIALDAPDTAALLSEVHHAYGTDVNELLLSGLASAFAAVFPESRNLRVDLERLGRDVDVAKADVSRTVGWFNTLHPLLLHPGYASNLSRLICDVKTRLRGAPRAGAGFGMLRYLQPRSMRATHMPDDAAVLFRHIGHFERLLCSGLLQPVCESAGRSRSPRNHLAYPLEITSRVSDDRLVLEFRYDSLAIDKAVVEKLADHLRRSLADIIRHCRSRDDVSRTPVDFPLAHLSQDELDKFPVSLAEAEDILPLSPIQRLYHTFAGTDRDIGFDQWVFRLRGRIDESAFESAWQLLLQRHDALRTLFVDHGLAEPHQVVMRKVKFRLQRSDWRLLDDAAQNQRLEEFLAADRRQGFRLDMSPLTRVTLIRSGDRDWIMVWSHHKAQVDGWSWPVIAAELGELHDAALASRRSELPPAGSYRSYIAWLMNRDRSEYARFWQQHLGSNVQRTLITRARRQDDGSAGPRKVLKTCRELDNARSDAIVQLARRLRLTPSVIFQGAWSLLVAGRTGRFNVTLGVAFSGRTAGIPVSENTIGPFVNDLPINVPLEPQARVDHWLADLRALQADVNHYQNVSPLEIHSWSGTPASRRLFDSLLVFQNYATGDAAHRWGKHIQVREFVPGIVTNYPLTVAVTPGRRYRIELFHDSHAMDEPEAETLANEYADILEMLCTSSDVRVATILDRLARPTHETVSDTAKTPGVHVRRAGDRIARKAVANEPLRSPSQRAPVFDNNDIEQIVGDVFREVLGNPELDSERNFFDAGAQSVSLIEVHDRLQHALGRSFPIVKLFQHPTISSVSQYLAAGDTADTVSRSAAKRGAQRRAAQQRQQARASGRFDKQP